MKIQNDVLNVLSRSTVDGNKLFLPPTQLDRKLYADVNKVLEGIGGKWNRSAKAHIFESDPSEVLDEVINTGEWTDKKKEFQFFETPSELASKMVRLLNLNHDRETVLEPSAGKGRIAEKITGEYDLYLIELNKDNFDHLSTVFNDENTSFYNGDFLLFDGCSDFPEKFDRVIMNPPFSNGQDVKHILHAWSLIKEGGTLVSIVSESPFFRENKLSQEFRKWIDDNNVEVESLDAGTFKESGTMVKTRLIVANK